MCHSDSKTFRFVKKHLELRMSSKENPKVSQQPAPIFYLNFNPSFNIQWWLERCITHLLLVGFHLVRNIYTYIHIYNLFIYFVFKTLLVVCLIVLPSFNLSCSPLCPKVLSTSSLSCWSLHYYLFLLMIKFRLSG